MNSFSFIYLFIFRPLTSLNQGLPFIIEICGSEEILNIFPCIYIVNILNLQSLSLQMRQKCLTAPTLPQHKWFFSPILSKNQPGPFTSVLLSAEVFLRLSLCRSCIRHLLHSPQLHIFYRIHSYLQFRTSSRRDQGSDKTLLTIQPHEVNFFGKFLLPVELLIPSDFIFVSLIFL